MSRRVILVPEFVVLLEKRLHRTLAMESAWCLGISLLLVFVFRWTPFFRRSWPGLGFGCTTLPPTLSCSYRSFSGQLKPSGGQLAWMLFVGSTRCILRRGRFLLKRIRRCFLLRVGVVHSIHEELTGPKGLKGKSCLFAR